MSDISVYITSDLTSSERRISPQWDLFYLKTRLELITGITPEFQTIHYYAIPHSNEYSIISDASVFSREHDSSITVASLKIVPFSRLHVIDTNPDSELKQLDMAEGSEFKLSEEEYQKRSNTVLKWKQENNLGRFDANFNKAKSAEIDRNQHLSKTMEVGNRCRVINIEGERRGTIKYVGKIDILDNGEMTWVGVEFDEPVGKNDGCINGVRFFDAKDKHGSFVKPKQVEVGDFPEIDPFASDDEEL
jgi:tubulin-folding cofactor B